MGLLNPSRFFIIGVGNIGLQLIRMLSRDFPLTCIDNNAHTLEMVKSLRGDAVRVVEGDATSRLVLEEAGISEGDTVIITTTSERVNLEVARVLRENFTVARIVAVGITKKGIEALENLEVEVEGIFNLSALGLRNRLEHKTKAVQGIGLGKNEILEVEVHPNSRVAHKRLSSINPHNWRVGIIYRDNNIVIPRGDTILKPKDRLIILGDPRVLQTVAEILTFRFQHFPLEYGDTLLVLLEGDETEDFFSELGYIHSVFPFERMRVLHPEKNNGYDEAVRRQIEEAGLRSAEFTTLTAKKSVAAALDSLSQEPDLRIGMTVLSRPRLVDSLGSMFARSQKKSYLQDLAHRVRCPLVLAGGSHPWEKVAVPCTDPENVQHVLETALEMSSAIKYEIEALLVRPSDYIATDEEQDAFTVMKKTVSDLSYIYKATIHATELSGNPIRSFCDHAKDYSLVVSDLTAWSDRGFIRSLFNPDVAWNIVRKTPVSVMVVPPPGELI
ncbi:hypothetical protein GSUB_02365 [Geoalkalibacter subterraneus]|uniref:RCK C-terminal domain-containing protein n=1 Tax=Geoalkalibacter subterraneus TaxID=483547 RepID=A0A0B5FLX5_9BACT|nr:hypothetical protein GSUB_02365 [Geoalkalibacter subterraneus]